MRIYHHVTLKFTITCLTNYHHVPYNLPSCTLQFTIINLKIYHYVTLQFTTMYLTIYHYIPYNLPSKTLQFIIIYLTIYETRRFINVLTKAHH